MIVIDRVGKLPSPQAAALKTVSLHITKGEVFGIIGRAGAGKSTLLRCINMLIRPDTGRIVVDGRDISTISGPKRDALGGSIAKAQEKRYRKYGVTDSRGSGGDRRLSGVSSADCK